MVARAGARLEEALTMSTAVPARLLGPAGAALGRIAPGCPADLVLWDSSMQVQATFIAGRCVFSVDAGGVR
jgi:N-acetylglucosamine-6-phosphate deacetylase